MGINVREQSLPGIGQRFEIDLDGGARVVVIAARDGGRVIEVTDASDEEPRPTVALSAEQAVMVGALLLGAQFSIDVTADERVAGDAVLVDTVAVPAVSTAVGQRPSAILAPFGDDAVVLGVIRDQTPELVEDEVDAPLHP
jgi:TrkA domain protein